MNFLLKFLELIQKLIKNGSLANVLNANMNQTSNPIPKVTIPSMNMILTRKWINSEVSIGELALNDVFECFTLENNLVIIPSGTYSVTIYNSPDHGFDVPLLHNVPNRDFIEIHPGNFAKDSKGCILVGQTHDEYDVYNSKVAFESLFNKIKDSNSIQITIK